MSQGYLLRVFHESTSSWPLKVQVDIFSNFFVFFQKIAKIFVTKSAPLVVNKKDVSTECFFHFFVSVSLTPVANLSPCNFQI
jgi:hypothetical protein